MRIRMNYYTDPEILHTDLDTDSGSKTACWFRENKTLFGYPSTM